MLTHNMSPGLPFLILPVASEISADVLEVDDLVS